MVSEHQWNGAIHFATQSGKWGNYTVYCKYPKDMTDRHARKLVAKTLIKQGVSRGGAKRGREGSKQ